MFKLVLISSLLNVVSATEVPVKCPAAEMVGETSGQEGPVSYSTKIFYQGDKLTMSDSLSSGSVSGSTSVTKTSRIKVDEDSCIITQTILSGNIYSVHRFNNGRDEKNTPIKRGTVYYLKVLEMPRKGVALKAAPCSDASCKSYNLSARAYLQD